MSFWFPAAFAFLGLVPLVVLLHLLRRRRQRLVVPSLLLWVSTELQQKRRPGIGKLGNFLALLLSLIILLLLILAIARPDSAWWFREHSTLVVLDARARMQAGAGDGRTVFDRARSEAEVIAARANSRHRIGLVVFPGGAVIPFSNRPQPLLEALARTEATEAGGDLEEVLLSVRDAAPDARIAVITDRQAPALAGDNVSVIGLGSRQDNVSITAFAARPSSNSVGMTDVFLRIANFGAIGQPVDVELRLDDTLIDVARSEIAADNSFERTFSLPTKSLRTSKSGILTAKVTAPSDALSADNVAQLLFSTGASPRVLLVSADDGYIEKAVSADAGIEFELLRPEAWQPGFAAAFPAVIFDRWIPASMADGIQIEGNFFFVGVTPWSNSAPPLVNPAVTDTDQTSPLLRGITLDGLQVESALAMKVPDGAGWKMVIASGDNALILTYQDPVDPARRSAVLGWDPAESDLPQRVAFPLLVSNTLSWLAGLETPATLIAGRQAPERAGIYSKTSIPGVPTGAAVNPDSMGESNLRFESPPDALSGPVSTSGRFPQLWQALLIGACALLVLEWVGFHRRWLT
jgi:hypothetical protein